MSDSQQMSLVESLQTLSELRKDEVVITAMGTAREWMKLSSHPLDWIFVPSSMGQATSLGLGMALAQPERKVIICNGDGSTLMNLGSLVSMTAEAPRNLLFLLFDNGVYEITGAQLTPGSEGSRTHGRTIDFASIATACGFYDVKVYTDLVAWQADLPSLLASKEGPICAVLRVAPVPGARGPKSPGPAPERARAFRKALIGDAG